MEKEFFDWREWDELGQSSFMFYKIKLVKDIGTFKAGAEFDAASIDFENGVMIFYQDDEELAKFKIGLRIV